jgi:outer membrane protein TolC
MISGNKAELSGLSAPATIIPPWYKSYLKRVLTFGIIGFAFYLSPGISFAEPPVENHAHLLENQALADRENAEHSIIRETAVRDNGAIGARILINRLEWVELSPRQAALKGLENSLLIKQSQFDRQIAQSVMLEARAVFDPVINSSVSYSHSKTYYREEYVDKYKKATTHIDNGAEIIDGLFCIDTPSISLVDITGLNPSRGVYNDSDGCEVVTFSPDSPVAYTDFDEPRPEGWVNTKVVASDPPVTGSTKSIAYASNISQWLPWGSNFVFSLNLLDKDNYWFVNSEQDDGGGKNFGTYGKPWVTSANVNVFLPLPITKYFGPLSNNDLSQKIQDINNKQGKWRLNATVNSTLLNVDLAFWNLVKAQNELLAIIDNQNATEELLTKTNHLFELRMITEYDKVLIEAELYRVRELEEQGWNSLLAASNNLRNILNIQDEVLFLPSGYLAALENKLSLDELNEPGIGNNPNLNIQNLQLKSVRLTTESAKVQTRPDLNMNISFNCSQNNQSYGYSNPEKSLGNILHPDTIKQTYGISYRYPILNRDAGAAYQQAGATLRQQEMTTRNLRNKISREALNAIISLNSARARLDITKKSYKLAKLSMDKAVRQQKGRTVTEYEIAQKNKNVLNSRKSMVQASVDLKKAEANLLAARGILAARYGEQTAQNDLDRLRLKQLQQGRALTIFASKAGDK